MANLPAFLNWHEKPKNSGFIVLYHYNEGGDSGFLNTVYDGASGVHKYLRKDAATIHHAHRLPFVVPKLNVNLFEGLKAFVDRMEGIYQDMVAGLPMEEYNEVDMQSFEKFEEMARLILQSNSFQDLPSDYRTTIYLDGSDFDVFTSINITINVKDNFYKLKWAEWEYQSESQIFAIYPIELVYVEEA